MTEMTTKLEVMNTENPRWMEFAETLSWNVLQWRCQHGHRHAERIMAAMGGINIPASIAFFVSRGGYCDCEILMNVLAGDDETPPETLM